MHAPYLGRSRRDASPADASWRTIDGHRLGRGFYEARELQRAAVAEALRGGHDGSASECSTSRDPQLEEVMVTRKSTRMFEAIDDDTDLHS
ncbi:MAG: hypothetical protein HOV81_30420 [Kofleriaceae bacterium]|nr:hypothetical protein [Kofleriaceae bacterium]